MLRHTLATLSYRLSRVLDGAPPEFATFRAAETVRTPAEILAHMGDLMDWAHGLAEGVHQWQDSTPLQWDAEIARFKSALAKLDDRLKMPLSCDENRLFQGPIADALTHTGQMALLRRMQGAPIQPKNYFKADI
ncbi:MAG: hypothetical protein HYX27_15830 [Acidobacteria bacterium]|nr:hypothetical protein [Acidobacteriota bacterium]